MHLGVALGTSFPLKLITSTSTCITTAVLLIVIGFYACILHPSASLRRGSTGKMLFRSIESAEKYHHAKKHLLVGLLHPRDFASDETRAHFLRNFEILTYYTCFQKVSQPTVQNRAAL